jgi:hypothetical protein
VNYKDSIRNYFIGHSPVSMLIGEILVVEHAIL